MAATRTLVSTGVKGLLCVALLSLAVVPTSCLRRTMSSQNDKVVQLSQLPNSHHTGNFDAKTDLEGGLDEGFLQAIQRDYQDFRHRSLSRVTWEKLRGISHLRRKRAVTQITTTTEVPESRRGVLIDFPQQEPNSNLGNRRFTLNSTNPEPFNGMFELSSGGQLLLRDGYDLDYENSDMRSMTFVVDAVSLLDATDIVQITATLTLTNVDEQPVFITEPKPYLATVRTNSGAGYTIITLVAEDPEGADVYYEKKSVSPGEFDNRIELRSNNVGNQKQCLLLTLGSQVFPADQIITISIGARDAATGGRETTTSVSVLVGVRPPQFFQSSYQGSIMENNRASVTLNEFGTNQQLQIRTKTFQNGQLTLSLMSQSGSNFFSISSEGYISCNKELNYEEESPKIHTLTVTATQRVGNVDFSNNVTVTVHIIDVNDNPPIFNQSRYDATFAENIPVGSDVLTVKATDADTGENSHIDYTLVGTDQFEIRTVNNSNIFEGVIRVKSPLDFDRPEGPFYRFTVLATDRGAPPLSASTSVQVTVTNINDEAPEFTVSDGQTFDVPENAAVDHVITQIQATDKDGDSVTYSLISGGNRFTINRQTGLLKLNSQINDQDDRFTLLIRAEDDGSCCTGGTTLSSTVTIYVQVNGINEEKPTFTQCSTYKPSILEHSDIGTSVQLVSAQDGDRGPNGDVTYEVTTVPQGLLKVDENSGLITVGSDIDREQNAFIQVTVKGRDGGNTQLEGWCTFRVDIDDINDHPPTFEQNRYVANITLDHPIRTNFLVIRAYDEDVGTNARITYSLVNDGDGKFDIIPENGFISLKTPLTDQKTYELTAMAKDGGNPPLNSTTRITVNIKVGTTKPPTWDRFYNDLTFSVSETVPDTGTPVIENMVCNSNIDDPRVEFQLIREADADRDYFFIVEDPNNRTVMSLWASNNLDYAIKPVHKPRLRCLNYGQVTLVAEVNPTVQLIDTNNQPPVFQGLSDGRYFADVQENQPIDTSVLRIVATDADATPPFNRLSFKLEDANNGFYLEDGNEQNTAVIYTNASFDREKTDRYFITVVAEDGAPSSIPRIAPNPNSATRVVNVRITDVNDNPPTFNQEVYRIEVNESHYIDQIINPPIAASDPDESDMGRHKYRIVSGNTNNAFGVRNGLGNLFPLRRLDYERGDKNFSLVLEASDGRFVATTTVIVTVLDVNDNTPQFDRSQYEYGDIVENDPNVPRQILTVRATDADVDRPNQLRYRLEGNDLVTRHFSIDQVSGAISVVQPLDRDRPNGFAIYQFTVAAMDELVNPNTGYASVYVTPKDVNDNAPRFITDPLEGSVLEHSPKGASVVLIQAEDYDLAENGTVRFEITNIVDGAGTPRPDYFIIEPISGLVQTNTNADNLDREVQDTYLVTVRLTDQGVEPQSITDVLTITLSDKNDKPPIFQQKIYEAEMSEKLESGEVIRVIATDLDIGENAEIQYSLPDQKDRVHFKVVDDNNEGSVQVYLSVDYENDQQRLFNLTVEAKDNAGHTDTCYVVIRVLDFNDNSPQITPQSAETNVSEAAPRGTFLFTFSATDLDSGINQQFEFSISRASDPRHQFFIDPISGDVKTGQRALDRETDALHILTIQAIDKGSPPRTGTATLRVVVEDVNDNYPTFLEDYQPRILEEEENPVERIVQEILAKDPDAPPFGAPFGFELTSCPGGGCPCDTKPTCEDKFQFSFNPNDAGGNGTATIRTSSRFDREAQKYYYIPIVMWDMRGSNSNEAQTGTNTLTVTIADINDNPMGPGTQDMFVYNYKGTFGPLDIGRVYVEDQDDWDLPDKTFTYAGPEWMKNYFTVDTETGTVTMQKGVPSNTASSPYTFTVTVFDKKFQSTVTSTVNVVIQELSEEAVRNSGAVRLSGVSAEEFIRTPSGGISQYDKLRRLLSEKLQTDLENVEIISVQDVEGGFTDVRYSAHGSPYYPPAQTDSLVFMNKAEFEQDLGATIAEVPIDACLEEVFEGGCYNFMNITGRPAMVNSNGTSFVGVEVFIQATEGCRAVDFPEPNECSGDYCYHGGTCVKDNFGVLSCQNCPPGFDGPRCQQLRHSFDGSSYALYQTLEQCEDSETSIEFITTQDDGLLLYNGPLANPTADQPTDYIALELLGGQPRLSIDHGSGQSILVLNGRNTNGDQVISSLADGNWHKIEIIRKGKFVEMIVDDCQAAAGSGSDGTAPDTSPCRTNATTPGENQFLNVATLLQVGGRANSFPPSVTAPGFNGCVKNLVHNTKYYDLHYKPVAGVPSGQNGCPREDEICGNTCGVNGICTASFTPQRATCVCKPSWRGSDCNTATTVRDLEVNSYLQWQLKSGTLPPAQLELQVMYRTYDTDGVLFSVSSDGNQKSVILELKDGRLQVLYNLGDTQGMLLLNDSQASNGQWHVARFKRVMHLTTLTLDEGEGRNHASHRIGLDENIYMTIGTSSPMYTGAIVTNPQGAEVIDRDLTDTCVQDVRLNGQWMPMKSRQNSESTIANFVDERNVKTAEECRRPNGCVPSFTCPAGQVCVDLWGRAACRCAPGYSEGDSPNTCISDCDPNPCFHNAVCQLDNGTVVCDCEPFEPWFGQYCSIYPTESDNEPVVGIAGGTIAAIVVAIVVAVLLVVIAFLLVGWYNRRKRDDSEKFVDDEEDYETRENVMFYDEEGAGEEDQNAFDLAKLPNPVSETMKPMTDIPRRSAVPVGRGIPDDRPDVGDVLHDRLGDADEDPEAPPYDTLITFNDEGSGSTAGSLSSLGSSSSDASQDYDYLHDWGPKFAKLADMYGAGQEPE